MTLKLYLPFLILISFCTHLSNAAAQPNSPSLKSIRDSMEHDDPIKTQALLSQYPNKTSYLYYLYSGNTALMLSEPSTALMYYKAANGVANNTDERRIALFGITRSALWLEYYSVALKAFDELSSMRLTPSDQEIVTTGRVIAKTNTDYPRMAFAISQCQLPPHYPMSVIATTKAALGAGWGYKAKAIWQSNATVLQQIPRGSFLINQQKNVDWLLKQQTSKEAMGLDYYTVKDSAEFRIDRGSVFASYRSFGVNSNSTVRLLKNEYFDPIHFGDSNMLLLKQDVMNINDRLDINLSVAPTNVTYKLTNQASWNPFLWNASGLYHINDYVLLSANNSDGLVETTLALENEILMNTTEGSVFLHPVPRIYARLTGFHGAFTDHNNRNGLSASLNYQLISELGLFGELRYRGYRNSFYNDPNYFSPAQLQEGMLFLIAKRQFNYAWFVSAEGGIGTQSILQTPSATTVNKQALAYNLALTKVIGNVAEINLNYGYNQAAFSNFVGAYAQTYLGASVKIYLN